MDGSKKPGTSGMSKSRSGCPACKKKRMKCDESRPACKNCLRRGIQCPGYTRQLKWSTKYEKLNPPNKNLDVEPPTITFPGKQGDAPTQRQYRSPQSDDSTSPSEQATASRQSGAYNENDFKNLLGVDGWPHDEVEQYMSQDAVVAQAPPTSPGWDYQLTNWTVSYMADGDEHAEAVMLHYFNSACRVMSCFDSPTNPYRTNIPQSLEFSPHIFHCLMSMSAAHLSNYSEQMSTATLTYQTKAVNMLQEEMARLSSHDDTTDVTAPSARYQILLGTIILGMTSAWHDPTKYALSHLQGARVLFQAWSAEQNLVDSNGEAVLLDREQSFIVGSMAYWECLASFLTDQAMDSVDYLLPFCIIPEGQTIFPNPWTGVSTPIFVYMAQTGILLRQKRVLAKLSQIKRGCLMATEAHSGLLDDARRLHDKVMKYTLPDRTAMEETGDATTPVSHLCDVAKIYRFINLLELYQAFPGLAQNNKLALEPHAIKRDLIFDLATSALTVISDLPRESGTSTVLAMAYICAGSALQHSIAGSRGGANIMTSSLVDELNIIRNSRPAVHWWRENVRQQILHAYRQLGLVAVQRGAKLVQEVWNRSDIQAEMTAELQTITPVHWMDVMIEQRLETLYG